MCLSGVMISDQHIDSSEKFASSYQRLSFDCWFVWLSESIMEDPLA